MNIGVDWQLSQIGKRAQKWEHLPKDTSNEPSWIVGKVVESTPPKRLVLTWAAPEKLKDESRVTFEIKAKEDMVCLVVTHDKFKTGSDDGGEVLAGAGRWCFPV